MRMRWLAVVVVVAVIALGTLLRTRPSQAVAASVVGTPAAVASGAVLADALQVDQADGHAAAPTIAAAAEGAAPGAGFTTTPHDAAGAAVGLARAADASRTAVTRPDGQTVAAPLRAAPARPGGTPGVQAASAASGASAAIAMASTALAGGAASGGLLPRATMVHSTTGTATIYNAQIEVGFVFDPSDNANHQLQFNGPDVAKSEFTLHGDAVSDATIDGQPAVAGQWYPLHAGLTLTAVSAVAVHVRPVAPKTDG